MDKNRLLPDSDALMAVMRQAALEAGVEIMRLYVQGCAVTLKADASPVSEADQAAEAIILRHLRAFTPDIPIVAEEEMSAGIAPKSLGDLFYLVDPLDGTKEFVLRNGDFTVNIALIAGGVPVAGVVYAPVSGQLYTGFGTCALQYAVQGTALNEGLEIQVRKRPNQPVAVVSRSHNSQQTLDYLQDQAIASCLSVGSSLKFCLLACGLADIYPRFSRTMEWDTAAGDAVLRAAGGKTLTQDGQALLYGKCNQSDDCDFANPHFIAHGG